MNPFSSVSQMTGIPSGKTRRGGRRGRSKGLPNGSPQTHVENISKALSSNDFNGAKPHAFALVRALHAAAPPAPKAAIAGNPSMGQPKLPASPQENVKVPQMASGAPDLSGSRARLANLLHGLKK
jgi:hypothetical protein